MLLTLYGSWNSKQTSELRALYHGKVNIPGRGSKTSERSVKGPGLTTRFEVQSIASGQRLTQWNSFCNVEGGKSTPEGLVEPLLEAKHRAVLKKLVDNYELIQNIGN